MTTDTFVANVVLFGRLLRRAGLPADPDRTRLFAQLLRDLGFAERRDVKAAGRALFTRRREDRAVYDAAFDLFWRRSMVEGTRDRRLPRIRQTGRREADVDLASDVVAGSLATDRPSTTSPVGASARERLRTVDFAELTPSEARDAALMLARLRPKLPRRPSRRPELSRSGCRLAARTMLRRSLSTGGETLWWRWFRRARRPRPLALLCDISGSMERYTRFILRFAHALTRSGAPLEVFVFGTRLTRITRQLRVRHPDTALAEVARRVVDWSGGTRIGDCLRELNQRWVRRTIRSSAIVLLVSDGWERGEPARLSREMARLQRSCYRLIWLDPLASRAGFEPATVGLRAALPHVDEFLPCGNVATLESLATRLGTARSMTTNARFIE